jgi:hypothetical protein
MWMSPTKTVLLLLATRIVSADPRCVTCHPKAVAAYAKSAMARSLSLVTPANIPPPGSVQHAFSKTRFTIQTNSSTITQRFERPHELSEKKVAFVIGSGSHASGYLVQMGDHLFQSPLSYYTSRHLWDVAPGYENDPHPDFSRPVTPECLFCHSGKPLPIADTLNRYQTPPFASYGISCERCHGDTEAHLKKPGSGTILNPARLTGAARDSICEQCHLTGEIRIPNPGKSILDFKPGQALEALYTTYVAAKNSAQTIKVVSHVEQLALSRCARGSGGKLWCGTCHNPHDEPAQPAAYFRERCLNCHAATLDRSHAAPGRDCTACHMPKLPASDGGHTAFTNHRIALPSSGDSTVTERDTLTAWREPEPFLRDRNLALALVTDGLQNQSSGEVVRGYRMLNLLEKLYPDDPAVLTTLGSVLMKGKQPVEALKRFARVIELKPEYAPYHLNLASALSALGQTGKAAHELETALSRDPLLQPAVELLGRIYLGQGQSDKADQLRATYDRAIGLSVR